MFVVEENQVLLKRRYLCQTTNGNVSFFTLLRILCLRIECMVTCLFLLILVFILDAVTAVNINIMVFSVVTPSSVVQNYQRVGRTCCPILEVEA
jgi:hypothetical protein